MTDEQEFDETIKKLKVAIVKLSLAVFFLGACIGYGIAYYLVP
jgi:hypothetical protein